MADEIVFNFPSTGNAEQDEEEARRIRRSFALRDAGLCPNDETPMVDIASDTKKCPQCGFEDHHVTLYVGG